jgi:hypothetical protein
MADNLATDAYKNILGFLERRGPLGKGVATAGRVLMPIVKIPTNYVAESLRYTPLGAVEGGLKLAQKRGVEGAMKRGVANMTPEEADATLRAFKKSSIGMGFIALGFFGYQNVGGYYQRGEKRKEDDVKANEIRLFGVTLPHMLLHNPLIEALNVGASLRRSLTGYNDQPLERGKGVGESIFQTGKSLIKQTPLLEAPGQMYDAMRSSDTAGKKAGEITRSLLVPQLAQRIIKSRDVDAEGKPIPRKPSGFVDPLTMSGEVDTEKQRKDLLNQLITKARTSGVRSVIPDVTKAIKDGRLKESDKDKIIEESRQTPLQVSFKNLKVKDAIELYTHFTPEKQNQVRQILRDKEDSIDNLPEDERRVVRERLRQVLRGVGLSSPPLAPTMRKARSI